MRREPRTLGALTAVASLALAATGFAQVAEMQIRTTEVIVPAGPPVVEVRHIEGTVVAVEPTPSDAKAIQLNNGERLLMVASTVGLPPEPRPGSTVQANYVDAQGEKVATFLRSDAEVQAP